MLFIFIAKVALLIGNKLLPIYAAKQNMSQHERKYQLTTFFIVLGGYVKNNVNNVNNTWELYICQRKVKVTDRYIIGPITIQTRTSHT